LTQVSSLLLAIVAAATFFRAGNRLKQKKRFNSPRIFLRFLAASLLFIFTLSLFGTLQADLNNDANDIETRGDQTTDINRLTVSSVADVALTAKYLIKTGQLSKQIEQGKCVVAYDCWQSLGDELSTDLLETGIPEEKALGILGVFSKATENSLNEQQIQQLQQYFKEQYLQGSVIPQIPEEVLKAIPDKQNNESQLTNNPSLIDWLKGIAQDLGLGFGWSALYFSIFTAWWKGQTPGKRLLGIKVLKLDGRGLNLWESFDRYGGYGAGLATGLLGFLQIYWDPNRQAIQDKISETLVIDLRKKRIAFEHPLEVEP
jgi:type II secretory pathway pseudopilin PulG